MYDEQNQWLYEPTDFVAIFDGKEDGYFDSVIALLLNRLLSNLGEKILSRGL